MAGTKGGTGGTRGGLGVGTRGGVGRIAAMAIALVVLLMLALADAARAGTYAVAQCGWGVDAEIDRLVAPQGGGTTINLCPGIGLRLESSRLTAAGEALRMRWSAAPGTTFMAVRALWAGGLAPSIRQQLGFDEGAGFIAVASAFGSTSLKPVAAALPGAVRSLEYRLVCLPDANTKCATTPASWTGLREATFLVADPQSPSARVGGPLLAPGWHRGTVGLELAGDDVGAGVDRLEALVGGAPVASAEAPCAAASIEGQRRATAMRPCPPSAASTVAVDTARLPDGVDSLQACAVDFAENAGCAAEVPISVDNSPPVIAFAAAADGRVAATVLDPFSGPASGSIALRPEGSPAWAELPTEFRRDGDGKATFSAKLPELREGAYVFRADATDGAGNVAEAQLRVAGDVAAIRRQAAAADGDDTGRRPRGRRRPTRLVARLGRGSGGRSAPDGPGGRGGASLTVPFGTTTLLRGRLTSARGDGVVERRVKVVAHPARGARRPATVRRVTTDRRGEFELRLPAGPSRRLVVSYPGGGGYGASSCPPLDLRVGAAVSLVASPSELRTGETLALRGRVSPGAGRIPARGKLVAIQYLERASGRWRPALVDRTDADGRFDLRYRFRYITGVARIRLRATALPEAGWPYAAGSSPAVSVEVRG